MNCYKSSVISNKCSKHAFSMVELLVVLAIIVIMTAALLMNQNKNKAQTDVETAARQIATQIRQLQNDALNGKQISGTNACSYEFSIVQNVSTYSANYYSDCAAAAASQISSTPFNLSNKVQANNTVSFYFTAPRGELVSAAAFPLRIIVEAKSDSNAQANVCVCKQGNIVESKTLMDCTDPKMCGGA